MPAFVPLSGALADRLLFINNFVDEGGEVYEKSLCRRDTTCITDDENSKNKTGKITNLMAVDAQKVSEITSYLFYGKIHIIRFLKNINRLLVCLCY